MSSACFHCGLPVPADSAIAGEIDGRMQRFCCYGCRGVAQAITAAGLTNFYRLTPDGQPLAPPPPAPQDPDSFDLPDVQEPLVQHRTDGDYVTLLVDGIHCAACQWLIERGMQAMPGIIEAQLNLSARRLRVGWRPDQTRLSSIIRELAKFGYRAEPLDPTRATNATQREQRRLIYRLGFAGFAAMNMMWIAIALYTGADEGEFRYLLHWAGFALATPTLLYSAHPFFAGAWGGLRNRFLTMDLPIALGATATYLYSCYVLIAQPVGGAIYFDTVVNFIFVILIGRYLESAAKARATSASQRLLLLQPQSAAVVFGGNESRRAITAVRPGDRIRIRPGERIPADGAIVEGRSDVDESMLTGESLPVAKTCSDMVFAGTLNGTGTLLVEVTAVLGATELGHMVDLVERAQSSKAPIQRLTDRIVPWFVGATLVIAAATLLLWWQSGTEQALLTAVTVLIVTCPCALGLATPMAVAVATGSGARHGILIKHGGALEELANVNHFAFDKTGTLTHGELQLAQIKLFDESFSREQVLWFAAALEQHSEHLIARAITSAAQGNGSGEVLPEPEGFHYLPGAGVRGRVAQHQVVLGTAEWLAENGIPVAEGHLEGAHNLFMACNGLLCAGFSFRDRLRADAAETLGALRKNGLALSLLSGDRRETAASIAQELGGLAVQAPLRPAAKEAAIKKLQQSGQQVAMVGDGINDAAALISADVGIALASGTGVSVESADIILIHDELSKLIAVRRLAKATMRTIKQNLGISLAYNLIMVPLAMAGFLTPLLAAISMPVSSLAVILNAARLRSVIQTSAARTEWDKAR